MLVASGCVIPPSLSVDKADAAVNSPPAIVSIHSELQELPEYSDVLFTVGTGTLTLELLDTDIQDDLQVRIFVDYAPVKGSMTAPRATCLAPHGMATRTTSCDLGALCLTSDVNQTRLMQVLVFDRDVVDSMSPNFQFMDPPGLSTSRTLKLECQSP